MTHVNYPIVVNEQKSNKLSASWVNMANSAVAQFGGFFDPFTGTNGAQTFAANQNIRGIITDVLTYFNGAYVSVSEVAARGGTLPGTFVAATTTAPARYTTSSTNVTRAFPDRIVYDEITIGDKIEAVLLSATGVPVARGTTAGSNVLNNFVEPLATHSWGIDEAGVSSSATGMCFRIVELPSYDITKVGLMLINASGAVS